MITIGIIIAILGAGLGIYGFGLIPKLSREENKGPTPGGKILDLESQISDLNRQLTEAKSDCLNLETENKTKAEEVENFKTQAEKYFQELKTQQDLMANLKNKEESATFISKQDYDQLKQEYAKLEQELNRHKSVANNDRPAESAPAKQQPDPEKPLNPGSEQEKVDPEKIS